VTHCTGGLRQYASALDEFQQCLEIANKLNDQDAISAIEKCIGDINKELDDEAEGRHSAHSRHEEGKMIDILF
jgi:hypothetical protein